jgi:hypothetical protein
MSARRAALQLLAVVLVFACTSDLPFGPDGARRSALDERPGDRDCALMVMALDTFASNGDAASLVLDDSTAGDVLGPWPEYAAGYRARLIDSLGLDPVVWDDFRRRNEGSVPVCDDVPTRLTVPTIRASELREAKADSTHSRWELQYDTWSYQPGGRPGWRYTATVSRAGVSADGRQALVQVDGICGGLCGSGWLIVLERGNDGWRVRGMLMTWVS